MERPDADRSRSGAQRRGADLRTPPDGRRRGVVRRGMPPLRRRPVQRRAAPRRAAGRRHAARKRQRTVGGDALARHGAPLPRGAAGRGARMGRAGGEGVVQGVGGSLRRTAAADRDRRGVERRLARKIPAGIPRPLRNRERRRGAPTARAAALDRRLPPLPVDPRIGAGTLRQSGVHRRKRLHGEPVVPLALHERRLRLARHPRPAAEDGLSGTAQGRPHDDGQCAGTGGGQPLRDAQHRGQPRRRLLAAGGRRDGGHAHRRIQRRRLPAHRGGRTLLPAADGGERGVRIRTPLHDRLPHPFADAPDGLRLGVAGRRRGRAVRAGEPLRRPAGGAAPPSSTGSSSSTTRRATDGRCAARRTARRRR